MASNFKNDRAWTPQDVKALECAMLNKLEIGFTSIDRDEIPNPNKLPLDAKPTDFMGRKLELEKSIFINSSILTKEMVAKVENAKENDDKEVLNTVLKQHMDTICKETFLDNNGDHQSLPDWVTVVKSQILETLATSTENWWKEFRGQKGKDTRNKKSTPAVTDDVSFQVKLAVNDINQVIKGFLIAAEEKERDAASKKVLKTVEVAADQASKNEVVTSRMMEHQGHLTSVLYKQVHEENQKQLKLLEVSEFLGNDSDRKVQARNLFNKVSSVFKDNGLSLPSSTKIEIWGYDKKKNPFVVAQFSNTSEARTFENQAAQARKKGLLKMKTIRMEPKEDPAFPIPQWRITQEFLKQSATARVEELKTQHEGDGEAMTKILVCEGRINDIKCFRQYNGKEKKIFFEFTCPFRTKRYVTSGISSPFSLIQLNDLK